MQARRNIEDATQAAIVQYIRLVAPHVLCFAVPNGGYRTKSEAARLKWTGVLAGVPDLFIIDEHGLSYGIEVKTVDGRPSEAQTEIHARMRAMKAPVTIVRNVNEARDALRRWGIATREAA